VRRSAFVALLLLLAASPAWAQEGEGAATFLGLPVAVWYAANLAAFVVLLVYLLAKPLRHFFAARRDDIGRRFTSAAKERSETSRLKAEMEARVASLTDEVTALKTRLQQEGEHEREALERQGEAEVTRLAAQIQAEAERRIEEARKQLAGEAARVAAELAWELLEREVGPADRERIYHRTLERLRGETAGGAR
jgi:F0F1-type ATP synthase membrane subunit b/b'